MSFSAARDIGSGDASRQSSRAPSPSFTQYHTFGPGVDGHPHDHRLVKLELSEPESCSKVIVHSRKSSTSSISSITSTRQRRLSAIGDSISSSGSHASTAAAASTNPTPSAHQCSTCGQRFAGPAVLIRHMESIHEKLLWSCVGCKSNLSRRDAVTRHINLSPMDSICRTVGRIGQIKTLNGVEVHYEISSYRAKPLEEVMNRMGKKIPVELKKGSDTVKGRGAIAAASGCEWPEEVLLNRHVEEDSKVDIKIEDCEDEGLGPYKKRRRHMLEVNQRKK
ncbi:hypothetical protein BGX28_008906 [Mortierella sp. GBA30]|nr:hypothetical protein BGX28_008906 [Mortierella sp. GBA30]